MEKEFEFNEFGVCLNPNILEREVRGGSFCVKTVLTDKGWTYGSEVSLPDRGYNTCCATNHEKSLFDEERKAIKAGLEEVREYASRQNDCSGSIKEAVDAIVAAAKEERCKLSYKQLDLFNL